MIESLPDPASKEDIEAAIEAFNNLSNEQKELVGSGYFEQAGEGKE